MNNEMNKQIEVFTPTPEAKKTAQNWIRNAILFFIANILLLEIYKSLVPAPIWYSLLEIVICLALLVGYWYCCVKYIKQKGYSGWLCLVFLIGFLGWCIIALLPYKEIPNESVELNNP